MGAVGSRPTRMTPGKGKTYPEDDESTAVMESFITQCPRPEGAVYLLFALSPGMHLQYVCSSNGAFADVAFPASIDEWPPGEAVGRDPIRTVPGHLSLHDWIAGLPPDGCAAWHPLQGVQGTEGLLLLWWRETFRENHAALDHLAQAAGIAGPVFRVWQSHRRHWHHYRRLELLEELTLAVASSLDLKEVLRKTRDALVDLGFGRIAIYVLDDEQGVLRGTWGTEAHGGSQDIGWETFPLSGSEDPLARVARGEIAYYLSEAPALKGAGAQATEHGAIVPLRSVERIEGVISVDIRVPEETLREEYLKVLLPFAAHAGTAVHNARLHERLANHLRSAEESENRRKRFEHEVILSVTGGKLHLCEHPRICEMLGDLCTSSELHTPEDVGDCRRTGLSAALEAGLNPKRRSEFELCIGEAATNCLRHAGGGKTRVYRSNGSIQIRVIDTGPGIESFLLPRATLLKGYSTTTSLGMGFSLMIQSCDRLYLATSDQGTDLLIELDLNPRGETERIWAQLGLAEV